MRLMDLIYMPKQNRTVPTSMRQMEHFDNVSALSVVSESVPFRRPDTNSLHSTVCYEWSSRDRKTA